MIFATIQQKSIDLSNKLREYAISTIENALVDNDLGQWFYGQNLKQLASKPDNFSWIYEMEEFENYNLEDYLGESSTEARKKVSEKNVKLAREMYDLLEKTDNKAEHVKVTFRRNREGSSWNYRAMAIFPEGTRLLRNLDYEEIYITKENPGIIFFEPGSSCIEHACDVLYKSLREKGSVGHFKYIAPQDLSTAIGGANSSNVEFMDIQTRETRDPAAFVLAGIMGYFSNQKTYRVPLNLLQTVKS